MKLAIHFHLYLRIKIIGVISPLHSPYIFMACYFSTGTPIFFYIYFISAYHLCPSQNYHLCHCLDQPLVLPSGVNASHPKFYLVHPVDLGSSPLDHDPLGLYDHCHCFLPLQCGYVCPSPSA
jgi:hypothetical protein